MRPGVENGDGGPDEYPRAGPAAPEFEAEALRLRLSLSSTVLVDAVLTPEGRQRLATAVATYVLTLDESLAGHGAAPAAGRGDGLTPRYHDAEAGQVTLHGRGSLQALTAALAHAEGSELRFRSNITLEGLGAWEEHGWVGRKGAHRHGDV